jgi:hypothetical protein
MPNQKKQRSNSWGGKATQSSSPVTETDQENVTDASSSDQTKKRNSGSGVFASWIKRRTSEVKELISPSPKRENFGDNDIATSPTEMNNNEDKSPENDDEKSEQKFSSDNFDETTEQVSGGRGNDETRTESDNSADATGTTDSSLVADNNGEDNNSNPTNISEGNKISTDETTLETKKDKKESESLNEETSDNREEENIPKEKKIKRLNTFKEWVNGTKELNDEGCIEVTSPVNQTRFKINEDFINDDLKRDLGGDSVLVDEARQFYEEKVKFLQEQKRQAEEAETGRPIREEEREDEGEDTAPRHTADLREPEVNIVTELRSEDDNEKGGEEVRDTPGLKTVPRNVKENNLDYIKGQIDKLKTNAIENENNRSYLVNLLKKNESNWGNYWQFWYIYENISIEKWISTYIQDSDLSAKALDFLWEAKKEVLEKLREFWEREDIKTTTEDERTETHEESLERTVRTEIPSMRTTVVDEKDERVLYGDSAGYYILKKSKQPEISITETQKDTNQPSGGKWGGRKIAAVILVVAVVVGAGGAAVGKWLQNHKKKQN